MMTSRANFLARVWYSFCSGDRSGETNNAAGNQMQNNAFMAGLN